MMFSRLPPSGAATGVCSMTRGAGSFVWHPAASKPAVSTSAASARRRAVGPLDRDRGAKVCAGLRRNHFDIPIVGLHVLLGNRQAEPGPFHARLILRPSLLERLENLLLLVVVDAGARVLDVDDREAVPCVQGKRDTPFGRRVLDRVRKQIVEHYSKLILVAAD